TVSSKGSKSKAGMASLPAGVAVPDHAVAVRALVEQERRAPLVDVTDEAVVDTVPDQLAQPRREAARDLACDPELLVLLLPDPAGAVVHRDADAALPCPVRAPAVPQAAVPDEHAAARHLGGGAVVALPGDARMGTGVRRPGGPRCAARLR